MKRSYKKHYKLTNRNLILNHITSNMSRYIIVLTIFIVGICIGVMVVNSLPDAQANNISEYINTSIEYLKNGNEISKNSVLKQSIIKSIITVVVIWLLGLTFFGNFLLYIVALFLGITFGYTISSLMLIFTFFQGILFFCSTMLLQNIITIPAIIFLIVQGLKFRTELVNKNSNIKYVTIKYSVYCAIVMLLLLFSATIEAYISTSLIYIVSKYL